MKCQKCGGNLQKGDQFCQFCGASNEQGAQIDQPLRSEQRGNVKDLFSGRIGRKHYIFAVVSVLALSFVVVWGCFSVLTFWGDSLGMAAYTILIVEQVTIDTVAVIWYVALVILGIRRLHDMRRSGYWVLLVFVPLVNAVFEVVLLFAKEKEPNSYGGSTSDLSFFRALFHLPKGVGIV